MKSAVYGFITVAENLFIDVPKSGASKLLYVLNKTKELCMMNNVEYNAEEWTDFINNVVGLSNNVVETKEQEKAKNQIIEKIKSRIPGFVSETQKLFKSIPDSLDYQMEYILKYVSGVCEKEEINVFNDYDWKGYIYSFYVTDKAV